MHITPKRRRPNWTPGVESLEAKALLSAVAIAFASDSDPADTLDQAADLGTFDTANISGAIDQNGSDVDWYCFTLDVASEVTLSGSAGTFSLYNDAFGTVSDPLAEIGHRQLAQFTAADSDPVSLTRDLAAGTYYVAVSGAGNLYFHSLLANSGFPGASGDYTLDISSSPLDLSSSVDPLPLSVDASPLGIWIGLSGELDFAPLVQITNSEGLNFPVARVLEALGGKELQVTASAPLPPGAYTVDIKDLIGDVRLSAEFTVSEVFAAENGNLGNDTSATAVDLGDIEDLGLVQVLGTIGDDTYYQLSRSNPALFAGSDVDLFHFHISSPTAVGLRAEAFARRIGSALDVGLSLYQFDPVSGGLVFVSGIDNSYNTVRATDGSMPLYRDAVMVTGLEAGDYYLAVSESANTLSPLEGEDPSLHPGIYDVSVAHSGSTGRSTGRYVLNLEVSALGTSPEVVSVSIADHATLPTAPSEFNVRFDEFMNLAEPAFAAFRAFSQSTLEGVYVSDALGRKYFPQLMGFDSSSFAASFQMAERFPAGNYEFHLSGNLGVKNLAGIPVAGNSSSGDYVVQFTVASGAAGTLGNPLVWTHDPQTDVTSAAQQLGVLFPKELQTGVSIVRGVGSVSNQIGDTADEYRFQVLQSRAYQFRLSGIALPSGVGLTLVDQSGNAVSTYSPDGGLSMLAQLRPGEYTLRVGTWASNAARRVNYRIELSTLGQAGDATPLTSGPAPAVGLRLTGMPDSNPGGGGTGPLIGGTIPGRSNGGSGTIGSDSGLGSPFENIIRRNEQGYLPLRTGVTQVDVSADGVTIAIPTVTSTYYGNSSRLRIQRAFGQGGGLRDQLSLSGLSALSDGPIGKARGRDGGIETSLTGRRLSDMIKLSMSSKPKGISEQKTAQNQSPAPANQGENLTPADISIDADAVTLDEHSSDSDRNPSTETSHVEPKTRVPGQTVTQVESITLPGDGAGLDAGVTALVESRSMTDTVFAAGLGLLMSELWLSRDKSARPALRLAGPAKRVVNWKVKPQTPYFQEDSAS